MVATPDEEKVDVPQEPEAGPRCWKCGCRDLRVYATRRVGDKIIRHRNCRNCGTRNVTTETAR